MEIRELSFAEYLFIDSNMRTALSSQYMLNIQKGSGKAFALFDKEKVISYILLYLEKEGCKITYICTDPNFYRRGYAEKLIRYVQQNFTGRIHLNITEQFGTYHAIDNCLRKLGFEVDTCSNIFTANVNEKMWEKMDKLKLSQMKDFLLRDGGKCIDFCNMDEDIKNQLLNSVNSEFKNKLNPAKFLLNIENNADEKLSTVMVKNGTVCSYALVTRLAKGSVCFEQISETAKDIGMGTVTAPLCSTLEKIRNIPEIEKINLCILDDNFDSLKYFFSMFSKDEIKITRNINYCYKR